MTAIHERKMHLTLEAHVRPIFGELSIPPDMMTPDDTITYSEDISVISELSTQDETE